MGPHGQENSFVLLKQGSPTPSLPFVFGDMDAHIVSKLVMAFKINNVREKGNTLRIWAGGTETCSKLPAHKENLTVRMWGVP